ncbi:MAG: hypothetical protein COC15_02100 [Legionellales bacterium]|nr:MAG: hypothetical protein COC15_02100 [Legionellales bacterium]
MKYRFFATITLVTLVLLSGCSANKAPAYLWQASGKISVITPDEAATLRFSWHELRPNHFKVVIKDVLGRIVASGTGDINALQRQLQQQINIQIPISKIANVLENIRNNNLTLPHRFKIQHKDLRVIVIVQK